MSCVAETAAGWINWMTMYGGSRSSQQSESPVETWFQAAGQILTCICL